MSLSRQCKNCNRKKKRHLYFKKEWVKKGKPVCKNCYKKSAQYRRELSRRYLNEYGITLEEYEGILAEQGGACYVCLRKPNSRRLAVDHDHAIEKRKGSRDSVRGLLCRDCNEYIGRIGDDPATALRLADYLERPTWTARKVESEDA